MAAALQHEYTGARDRPGGSPGLAGQQQPVLATPGDGHRHRDRLPAGELKGRERRQGLIEPGRVGESSGVVSSLGGRQPFGPRYEQTQSEPAPERGGEQGVGEARRPPRDADGDPQRGAPVAHLGPVGEAGGGEGGGRTGQPPRRHLERDQPAHRVTGHVGPLHAQLRQELRHQPHLRVDAGRRARRGHRRGAEPGEVDGDDVVALGQTSEHRLPHLPAAADPVHEQQGLAAPGPHVVELHRPNLPQCRGGARGSACRRGRRCAGGARVVYRCRDVPGRCPRWTSHALRSRPTGQLIHAGQTTTVVRNG